MVLYRNKIISKSINKNIFTYLVNNSFLIRNPYPFVINFDLASNEIISDDIDLSKLFLFNINSCELEFHEIKLSLIRNRIYKLKNISKDLLKKEIYWMNKRDINKRFLKSQEII